MKPALHLGLVAAAALCLAVSFSLIVQAGDEVRPAGSFVETLGYVGFYASGLALAGLLTYAGIRFVGWVARTPHKCDPN